MRILRNPPRCGSSLLAILGVYLTLTFCVVGRLAADDASAQLSKYPQRPIRIICPWAAGGGTDRVSRQLAMQLEIELGIPVTVVNATGGKGVTGHHRGLTARPDGYTLAMMTFELNTMHWMGLTKLTYENCIPLVSVNEDYAALFVSIDSPWQTLSDVQAAVEQQPGQLTASGTASGGAWHLALAGWLTAAGLPASDVTWVPSQGSSPSLQQLLSGGVDMVCCSLPEARAMLEAKQIRAIGVMSPTPAVGFESVPTFVSQGTDWTLGGWRGLGLPIGTPVVVVEKLRVALESILSRPATESGSFANFMRSQKFDNTSRSADDFLAFMAAGDKKLGALLQSEALRSVSRDRFNPMLYPAILACLLAASCVGMTVSHLRSNQVSLRPSAKPAPAISNFVVILFCVAFYVLAAETAGFIVTAATILALLQMKLGTGVVRSLLVAVSVAPGVYIIFAKLLRVGLPAGWLG